LTRTDDLLLELRRTYAAYLKSFFPFEWENKTYRLVNNYVASPWTRCDVCGNYPIKEVSVIRSSDGGKLRVGNKCIDRLTNRKVSGWFRIFRKKRKNIIRNRRYIDDLASILTTYRRNELPFHVSENDMGRLQRAFERMRKGLNPTTKQEQLAKFYISRMARATNQTQ
jgi:hypothetical protein